MFVSGNIFLLQLISVSANNLTHFLIITRVFVFVTFDIYFHNWCTYFINQITKIFLNYSLFKIN